MSPPGAVSDGSRRTSGPLIGEAAKRVQRCETFRVGIGRGEGGGEEIFSDAHLLYASVVWLAHHAIFGHAWAGQASPSALKVGIVDLDRALKESRAGKQALATLKQFRDKARQGDQRQETTEGCEGRDTARPADRIDQSEHGPQRYRQAR